MLKGLIVLRDGFLMPQIALLRGRSQLAAFQARLIGDGFVMGDQRRAATFDDLDVARLDQFDLAPVIPPLVSRVRSGFALFGLGDQQARERSHCGAQAIGPVGF